MKAAILVGPARFEIAELDRPEPGPGEVRVRLEGTGVCASNVEPFEGQPWSSFPGAPGGLGHEGWGVVDALGEGGTSPSIGARVALLSERAFAEYDVAPADALVELPEALAGPFRASRSPVR